MASPGRGLGAFDSASDGAARHSPQGPRRRRKRRLDLVLGIALGIVLGVAIVVAFVFFGSEDTIDAPSIDERPPVERPAEPAQRR